MNNALIKQLAAEISAHIAPEIPVIVAYWDVDKIAACLSYEPRTVRKLTARADFPLPRNPGNGQKRWRAKEVLAWVETFKAKEAKL